MKNKNLTIGIIIAIIGISSIIVSETANFVYETKTWMPNPFGNGGTYMNDYAYNSDLKDGLLYGGIALFILGGVIFAISLINSSKNNSAKNISKNIIYCPQCGKEHYANSESKYCDQCGNQI